MLFLLSSVVFAHKPSFGDEPFSSVDNSYDVDDPNISIVVYQDLTCEDTQLWLHFETTEQFELYVQLGVPVIDRLQGYTPSVAVVAENLTERPEVPFEIPEGMGAVVFAAEEIPQEFYEPFTQTESWIWVEQWVPVQGEGYIVGWHPEQYTGKIWIATGEVENFEGVSISEFAYWTEAVNNFHETGKFEYPPNAEVIDCLQEDEVEEPKSGCSSLGTTNVIWYLVPLVVLGYRRR